MNGTRAAKAPTIKDVAARAGVSKSVVSRVLRDSALVSAASRASVREAIADLDYRPNAAARTLVQQRSHAVAVLVTDLRNLFLPEVMQGLDDALDAHGYTTVVVSGHGRERREEAALRRLLELRVDGIVLATAQLGRDIVLAAARSAAVVNLSRTPAVPRVDSVVNDDRAGARLAVEHLIANGHNRIAMVGDNDERAGADRISGYREAMSNGGLGAEVRVVAGGFTERGGYEATSGLLSRPERPTGVFVASDLAALGVLNAAFDAGIAVPRELSVVGYDNTPFAALRHIGLSSVDQSAAEIGGAAASALLRRLERPGRPAHHQVIVPRLIARRTSGPAPEDE